MLEAQPDFDPHNLKHQGINTPKSAHINEPYEFQEFPKLLYRRGPEGTEHLTVHSADSRDKALSDGWSEEAGAKSVEKVSSLEPVHVVIDEPKKEPVVVEPAPVVVEPEPVPAEPYLDPEPTFDGHADPIA